MRQTIQYYFELGGPLMWPLAACSVLLWAVALERFWTLGVRSKLAGRMLTAEQRDAHRHILPFFKDVPPALGLLGTVIGVVQSFSLADGKLDASSVGSGLAVACLTTIVGLCIAILASLLGYLCDAITHRDRNQEETSQPQVQPAAAPVHANVPTTIALPTLQLPTVTLVPVQAESVVHPAQQAQAVSPANHKAQTHTA